MNEREMAEAAFSCVKDQRIKCTCLACSWDRIAELEAENEQFRKLIESPQSAMEATNLTEISDGLIVKESSPGQQLAADVRELKRQVEGTE